MMSVGEKQLLRFGPFQLDPHCGQLRKDGAALKLQGQPVEILKILLETPGEFVTRDELRQRIWASDTFVDFDHSLNTAVKKLRQALGDEADTPSYIQTLPKRGYRFISEVHAEHSPEENPVASSYVPQEARPQQVQATRSRYLHYGVTFIAVIALVGVLLLQWRARPRPNPVRIVQFTSLPGFEGNPSFSPDGTQIVFAAAGESEGADVYVKAIGDEKMLRLTEAPVSSSRPQ